MAAPLPPSCPRPYSVEEILALRSSLPVVKCVIKKLNKHPDIAAIFRIPEEAFKNPERYFCRSKALIDVTNQRKVLRLGNRRTEGGSPEESEEEAVVLSKLTNHSRAEQWHLRRRDSAHRSSQPNPAPSGIVSQQNENFQRFYRAVVSPSHVRVTAGGRIVPNTRATVPPQFDWNPEKRLFEPRRVFPDTDPNTPPVQTLWLPNSPQTIPGSLLPPGSLPSYNFLSQSASLAQATMATQSLNDSHVNGQSSSENGQLPKEISSDPLQPMNSQQPFKISPPSQFDHSRPFMFNGQVVYPLPAGFQPPSATRPLPITVLGDPNLPHQASQRSNFLPSPYSMPVPLSNFANPVIMPSGPLGHFPMMMSNGVPFLESGMPMAPYSPQPAPGMISLSELTKFQINGFRNQVKHVDNQLANNQHLVDKPFLQRQRTELIAFIEKMEAMLQIQLGQEGDHLSLAHLNGKTRENSTTSNGNSSTETLVAVQLAKGDNVNTSAGRNKITISNPAFMPIEELKKNGPNTASPAIAPPIPLFVPTSHPSATQTKTEDFEIAKPQAELKPLTKSEPTSKSRLTAAAAKAPPFQPRANSSGRRSESEQMNDIATQASSSSVGLPLPDLESPSHEVVETRSGVHSSAGWCQPADAPGVDSTSLPQAQAMQAPHILDDNYSGLLHRSQTFHAPLSSYEAGIMPGGPLAISPAVPYLVGTLPSGMHISEARGAELVYARPLTEPEIRARYLYWGDAPRSAMKGSGLPKFDGKDFYPPSPVKRQVAPVVGSNTHYKSTSVSLPDFEKLFTEPQVPSYQTPPQLRTKSTEQNLPTPTQAFLQNDIIGFQSPSPRPATYRFDNSLRHSWSLDHYGVTQASIQAAQAASVDTMQQPISDDFSTIFTAVDSKKQILSEDFSKLFTSPPTPHRIQHIQSVQPSTPDNKTLNESIMGEENEPGTLDSWGAPKNIGEWTAEDAEKSHEVMSTAKINDLQSNDSTVDIRLTSENKEVSPKRGYGRSFADRMFTANGGDQVFLQKMLRNTTTTMAAPALSGAISSATAQGYLPQYRGSAAASLAPTILTSTTMERTDSNGQPKIDHIKVTADGRFEVSTEGVAPLIAANFMPENRPIDRDRPHRPIRASVDTMGAEGYMRYLSQRAEADKKIVEQGWNFNTKGTGPVMGSDW